VTAPQIGDRVRLAWEHGMWEETGGIYALAEGHIGLTPVELGVALVAMISHWGLPPDRTAHPRVTRTWRGDCETPEWAWLICDENGYSGYTHECDGPCAIEAHRDADGLHDPDDALEDYSDCRCDEPGCPGNGNFIPVTNIRPITLVEIR
jgi:hypothetical protein